jgi:hypothetical protein
LFQVERFASKAGMEVVVLTGWSRSKEHMIRSTKTIPSVASSNLVQMEYTVKVPASHPYYNKVSVTQSFGIGPLAHDFVQTNYKKWVNITTNNNFPKDEEAILELERVSKNKVCPYMMTSASQ